MNYLQSTQNTANNPGHGRWFAIRGCCDVVLTVGAHHVYGTEPVVRLRQILNLNKKKKYSSVHGKNVPGNSYLSMKSNT